MAVQALDHVNIRVKDPAATAAFFTGMLGMAVSPERASWITDAAGRPVIHIGSVDAAYPADSWRPFVARDDSGAVHHVALACDDHDSVLARLQAHGVEHRQDDFPSFGLRQILVMAPGGVMLELNFRY